MNGAKKSTGTTELNASAPVHVVGAGIAGLASALAFSARGRAVFVSEQAEKLTEVGAGIQISPNGVAVLDALGLGDKLRRVGVQLDAVHLHEGLKGARVAKVALEHKRPYLALHRADLIDLLANAVIGQGINVNLARRIDATHLDGLTIAADGLHSGFRDLLVPDAKAHFTGQVAWRAVVPAAGRMDNVARIDMAPGGHVVTYPIRAGGFVNIVAVEERKSWVADGWTQKGDVVELRERFGHFGPFVADLLARVERVGVWGLHRYPVASRWHDESLTLVGDAAHPTLPFMAQGANLALEDAWVLAQSYDPQQPQASLARYQQLREDRVRRAVNAAEKNARNYHLRNPVARFVAHNGLRVISSIAPNALSGQFDWLYGHNVVEGA